MSEHSRVMKKIHWYSNEGQLHVLNPYIKDRTGSILAVGSDQALDLLVNSGCSRVDFVDNSRSVQVMMRGVLEVGRAYRESKGSLSPHSFFNFFDYSNLGETRQMITALDVADQETFLELIGEGLSVYAPQYGNRVSYGQYMQLRAGSIDQTRKPYAWYASPESLDRVIDAYTSSDITFTEVDLCKMEGLKAVSENARVIGSAYSVVYLSNVEDHLYNFEPKNSTALDDLWKNIESLPLDEKAIALRTAQVQKLHHGIECKPESLATHSILYNLNWNWHYNAEDIDHNILMAARIVQYRSNRSWIKLAKGYRRLGLEPQQGVSRLTKELTEVHIDRLVIQ